jgi:hypothetical protein
MGLSHCHNVVKTRVVNQDGWRKDLERIRCRLLERCGLDERMSNDVKDLKYTPEIRHEKTHVRGRRECVGDESRLYTNPIAHLRNAEPSLFLRIYLISCATIQ